MIPDAAKSLFGRSALSGLQGHRHYSLFIFVIQYSYIPMTDLRLVRPLTLFVIQYSYIPMTDLRLVKPQTLFVIQYSYSSCDLT